ncbi:MAG TPA: HNH endonuclease [Solirubrobacterales bacterium]|jgi:5-methylcytosine-specific restriction endonuclease McrA|nr:HNH endonuclease [Solirubrobacterales bacterium]
MRIPSASNPLLHWDPAASDPAQRRIHPILRGAVLERDGWTCAYCGKETAEVDHVAPRGRGGRTVPANLVAACRHCNKAKGLRTPTEWRLDRDLERIRRNAKKRRPRNRPRAVCFRRS